MYISKYMIDNADTNIYAVDKAMLGRAKKIYEHFKDNDLFYVDDTREYGHIFFDGKHTVEVTRTGVRFCEDIDPSKFTRVDFNGQTLIRYNRSLKPEIYHPKIESDYEHPEGNLSKAERDLLEKHDGLSQYCLYNRIHTWNIDMCDNNYPIKPGASLSNHVVKLCNWFKQTFHLDNITHTKCYHNKVSCIEVVY